MTLKLPYYNIFVYPLFHRYSQYQLEPEAPSSISERLSDSFSAIGEGVRNHFRSLSENFSDTLDDLKDAWRLSEKRG